MKHEIPELDRKGLRSFGLVTGGIVAVLFGLIFPWLLDRSIPLWPFIVFAVLGFWGLIAPLSLRPVYRIWMHFGLFMSRFMTPLILGITFFLVITPGALLKRIFGEDSMKRELTEDKETYRVVSKKPSVENLERMY